MMSNPFRKKGINKKRAAPRRVGNGRVKLYGADKTDLRRKAFERSGGTCEVIRNKVQQIGYKVSAWLGRCDAPITWETMELSHDRHGPNKSDTLESVKASCSECHKVGTHNPKSCKRRPGKPMRTKDAKDYWLGTLCSCDQPKNKQESFCADCRLKVNPQTLLTLENADDPDTYRETLAQAEIEILQFKPVEG